MAPFHILSYHIPQVDIQGITVAPNHEPGQQLMPYYLKQVAEACTDAALL
jgi:hypothetical protein